MNERVRKHKRCKGLYAKSSGLPTTNEYDGSFAIRSQNWGEEPDGPSSRRLLPKAQLQKQEELACPHDKKERRRTKDEREGLRSVYEGRLWLGPTMTYQCKRRGDMQITIIRRIWYGMQSDILKEDKTNCEQEGISALFLHSHRSGPMSNQARLPRLTRCFCNVCDKKS